MSETLFAELSFGNTTLRLPTEGSGEGIYVELSGIKGWWSTPDPKWKLTELQSGDGAHAIEDEAVLYAARTVTASLVVIAGSRERVAELWHSVLRCAHRPTRLRVVDGTRDTYVTGYPSVESEPEWHRDWAEGTLTLECPDPRRYATKAQHLVVSAYSGQSTEGIGLRYGEPPGRAGAGLSYPLAYGPVAADSRNVCTLANAGTSTAWPAYQVHGGVAAPRLDLTDAGGSSAVEWSGTVGGVPLDLDSLRRSASVAGVDKSALLARRGFRGVAPGGSLTVSYQAATGWADVWLRDTYI